MPKHPTANEQRTTPHTWQVLLAKWVEFAKAAASNAKAEPGSPAEPAATALNDAVPHVITLQAHTFALADAARLPPDERAAARDRAGHAVSDAAQSLREIYSTTPMPPALLDLLTDARTAIDALNALGLHLRVTAPSLTTPDPWPLAESLLSLGYRGDLLAPPPGVVLAREAPALLLRPEPEPDLLKTVTDACPGTTADPTVAPPQQLYRVFADASPDGEPHDLLAPMLTDLPAGRPILETVLDAGQLRAKPDAKRLAAVATALNTPLEHGRPLPLRHATAETTPSS